MEILLEVDKLKEMDGLDVLLILENLGILEYEFVGENQIEVRREFE